MFITAVEENTSFNKMIKCALQDIYLHSPNIKWNDIIGLDAAKQLVKEAVVYPIRVRMGSLMGVFLFIIHWTNCMSCTHQEEDRMFFCHQVNFLPVSQYLVKRCSTKAQSVVGNLESCYILVQGRCLFK